MTYRGHLVTGSLAVVGVRALTGVSGGLLVWMGAVVLFGALAPDFDHPQAFLSRRFPFVHWGVRLLLSNPLTWIIVGSSAQSRVKRGWLYRIICNTLSCKVFGQERAEGWARRITSGRMGVLQLMGHRGLSHSVLGVFVAVTMLALAGLGLCLGLEHAGVLSGLPRVVWHERLVPVWFPGLIVGALGFAVGYLVHIASDMATVSGVMLGQPWSRTKYWVLPKRFRLRTR